MAETGVVESFFHDKGYGWIKTDTPGWNPVFFHKKHCKDAEHLTPGDRVKFNKRRFVDMTESVENVTVMTMTESRTREAPQEADGAGSDVAALGSSLGSSRGSSRGSSSYSSSRTSSELLSPYKRSGVKETFPEKVYSKDAFITVDFYLEINKVVVRKCRLDVQRSELVSSVKSTINHLMQYCWELLTFERWIELKLAFGADGDLDDKCPLHYYQIRDGDIVRVLLRSPSINEVMVLEAPARATRYFFDAPGTLNGDGLCLAP